MVSQNLRQTFNATVKGSTFAIELISIDSNIMYNDYYNLIPLLKSSTFLIEQSTNFFKMLL